MNRMSPYFIVNPVSANGNTRKLFLELLPKLKSAFEDIKYVFTEYPLHAIELAKKACLSGVDMIVSCGGDGTLNEVVSGIYESNNRVLLGVLPSGTGGDFRRMFGFPVEANRVISYLKEGKERQCDLGILEFEDNKGERLVRPFINIASFGISGVVDHFVNSTTKIFGGRVSFIIGTLRGMLSYENQEITVLVDGQVVWTGKTSLVAIANGRFFGGGMMVAPNAKCDDGLFDIVIFGDMNKIEFLNLAQDIYSGRHIGHSKIITTRGKIVEAQSVLTVLIDLDGEQPGRLPCKAEIKEGWIRLLTPY